ncbi:MAG: hypothetical protein IIZ17_07050 [Eubacteriaceae bacterium]|nr:hypothetical protein [Eubacteriaceae bacterium]
MRRVRRVGSFTSGAVMVVSGVLLMMHTVFGTLSYRQIFRFWPVILISLGAEMLLSVRGGDDYRYDGAAVVMMFVTLLFAMALGAAEMMYAAM